MPMLMRRPSSLRCCSNGRSARCMRSLNCRRAPVIRPIGACECATVLAVWTVECVVYSQVRRIDSRLHPPGACNSPSRVTQYSPPLQTVTDKSVLCNGIAHACTVEILSTVASGQYAGTAGLYSLRRLVIRIVGCKALARAPATACTMHALAGKRHSMLPQLAAACALGMHAYGERRNKPVASTGAHAASSQCSGSISCCGDCMTRTTHVLRRGDLCA